MNFINIKNRSFFVEIFLILIALWLSSYVYQYSFQIYGLKPLYTYGLIILFTSLFMLREFYFNRTRFILASCDIKFFYIWIVVYALWVLITYFHSSQSFIAGKALIGVLESSVLLICFLALVNHPVRVRRLSFVFAILALFGTGMCLWDFINPTLSNVPGRGAGFYVNPTIAGHVIALTLVGGFYMVPKRARVFFIVFCGVGVLVTFTRAAWLLWGVAVVGIAFCRIPYKGYLRIVTMIFVVGLVTLIMYFLFSGKTEYFINYFNLNDYMTPNTLHRLGISDSSFNDFSSNARKGVITFSVKSILESPIRGHGVGYVREWAIGIGPHNMYLQQWVEGGIFQFILYVGFLVFLWNIATCLGKIMVIQFFVSSLFTHNNLEQPVMLLLFAFIVGTRLFSDTPDGLRPFAKRTSLLFP